MSKLESSAVMKISVLTFPLCFGVMCTEQTKLLEDSTGDKDYNHNQWWSPGFLNTTKVHRSRREKHAERVQDGRGYSANGSRRQMSSRKGIWDYTITTQ